MPDGILVRTLSQLEHRLGGVQQTMTMLFAPVRASRLAEMEHRKDVRCRKHDT